MGIGLSNGRAGSLRERTQSIRRRRSELPTTLSELHIMATVASEGGSAVSTATGSMITL